MTTLGDTGERVDLVFRDGAFVTSRLEFSGIDMNGFQVRAAVETPDGVKHPITCSLVSYTPELSVYTLSMSTRVYASMPARLRVLKCPWDALLVPPVGVPIPLFRGDAYLERPIANVV